MNQHQNRQNHFQDAKSIWKIGPRLRLVEEFRNPIKPAKEKAEPISNSDVMAPMPSLFDRGIPFMIRPSINPTQ